MTTLETEQQIKQEPPWSDDQHDIDGHAGNCNSTSAQENVPVDVTVVPTEEIEITAVKMPWYRFDGVRIAQGYNMNGLGRGALVMSNIFLSTAFIYLAQEQAGCIDEDGEVIEDCKGEAYGFKPASFVSYIAVLSGVLSALFMPLIGAMIDYTDHRKTVGVVSAVLMIMIQVAQIGTRAETWFAMAVLQAVAGFLYQAQILSIYAYLPDMSYIVGEASMTKYTATFTMTQFSSQSAFISVIITLSLTIDLGDVASAQMSQGINVLWSGLCFYISWRILTPVSAKRALPEGHSLLTEGFTQVYRTTSDINRRYKRGTRWFFLALIFAEASASAFITVSVVFLDVQLGMSAQEIAIFFLVTLLFSIPGSFLGSYVTKRLDPKQSWQINMVLLFGWAAGGAILLDSIPAYFSFAWGCGIGVFLGWFYPVENLFFSMCLPKGQEAELSGFFVYCTQILGWLPPLIFSFILEYNVSQTYGVVAVTSFLLVAVALLGCAAPWNDILVECGRAVTGDDTDNREGEAANKASTSKTSEIENDDE